MSKKDPHSSVSLKEFFLAILAAERERADHHKALANLRFDLADKAQQLDHIEMLRRLELLNHAHDDAREKEASFVGREVYESQNKEHYKWRDEVNSALAARQGRSSVTASVTGAVGGLALSALFGLIMYLTKVVLSGFPK